MPPKTGKTPTTKTWDMESVNDLVGLAVLVPHRIFPKEKLPKNKKGWEAQIVQASKDHPGHVEVVFADYWEKYYFPATEVRTWDVIGVVKDKPGKQKSAAPSTTPTAGPTANKNAAKTPGKSASKSAPKASTSGAAKRKAEAEPAAAAAAATAPRPKRSAPNKDSEEAGPSAAALEIHLEDADTVIPDAFEARKGPGRPKKSTSATVAAQRLLPSEDDGAYSVGLATTALKEIAMATVGVIVAYIALQQLQ